MVRPATPSAIAAVLLLGGCAHLELGEGAGDSDTLRFHDAVPHLLVTTAPDCTVKAEVITLPGTARWMRLHSGYGSAALTAAFANGLLTSVGQTTDTKIPETTGAVAGFTTAVAGAAQGLVKAEPPKPCAGTGVKLYSFDDKGMVNRDHPVSLP